MTAEKDRDTWKGKAIELDTQLRAVASEGPAPTRDDPLADVIDAASYAQAEKQMWDWLEFAEKYPDGVDDYLVRTNADGSKVLRDYPRAEVIDMKMTAQKALAANGGLAQKAEILRKVDEHAKTARAELPELFSEEPNEVNQAASEILRELPVELRTVPKWPIYLMHVVKGEMQRQAKNNGAPRTVKGKPLSANAEAILNAPKITPAPGVAKTRAAVPQGNRDEVEAAKKAHIDSGFSSETLERLITAKRRAQEQPSGNKTRALV